MQTILVIATFSIAAGFLLKKFVWTPVFEKRKKATVGATLDGGKTKCGDTGCGCH
jgi:hypothetical protein